MARQAIFTSLPEGLIRDQSGFCVAARHEDLPRRLLRELERLSFYAHLAAPSPDSDDINPVIASHRIVEMEGTRYHVLSRIQSAGFDYCRRSNHIAHHLVLTEEETAGAPSPAHILRAWPGWRAKWDELPRFLREDEKADLDQLSPPLALPAIHWEQATKNHAHAALLVDGQSEAARECYVVAPLHLKLEEPLRGEELLLRLFEESLLLLEPEKRWQTTFTTFLQSTDNPADFAWRGWRREIPLSADVPSSGAPVFDLVLWSELPAPGDPSLAGLASTGPAQYASSPQLAQLVWDSQSQQESPQTDEDTGEAPHATEDENEPATEPAQSNEPVEAVTANLEEAPAVGESRWPTAGVTQEKPPIIQHAEPAKPDSSFRRKLMAGMLSAFGVTAMLLVGAWWMTSRPEPQPEQPSPTSLRPLPAGVRELTERPSPSAASSETTVQPPIYLVMDGDDIGGILTRHFGAGISKDTLAHRCRLQIGKADGNLPHAFSPGFGAKIVPETGGVYHDNHEETARLFKLDSSRPSELTIRVDDSQKTSHWFIRFLPTGNGPPSDAAQHRACDILLWVPAQPSPFNWGADCLELDNGRLAIKEETRKKLQWLRPTAGSFRLVTRSPPQEGQLLRLVMQSPALDASSLDYKKLVLDIAPAASQYDKPLEELKRKKAALEHQYRAPENVVKNTQQWLLNEPDLNTACGQLFDCVLIKAQKWNFDDYWRALPSHTKQGKDLPEWGDYCNYLVYICEAYIAQRLESPLSPIKKTKIRRLLFDSNAKPIPPENLADLIDRLEKTFSVYLRSKSPRSKPDSGATSAPRPYSNFKNEWNRIFAQERIRSLQNLIRDDHLDDHVKQIGDLDQEIQRTEDLKQHLPKTPEDWGTVWLAWEVHEAGKTRPASFMLARFGNPSVRKEMVLSAENPVITSALADDRLPVLAGRPVLNLKTQHPLIHVVMEGQDIKPALARVFGEQINRTNLNAFCEIRVRPQTDDGAAQTLAPAVYLPETGNIYSQDKPVITVAKGPGISPQIKDRQTHWFLSFTPRNDASKMNSGTASETHEFLLLVSKQPPLPPLVALATDDLRFQGRRVIIGPEAVEQLKSLQPASGRIMLVTTIQGQMWCSLDSQLTVSNAETRVNYSELGLNFAHLEQTYGAEIAKLEKPKAGTETQFDGLDKARDLILHDPDLGGAGGRLLRSAIVTADVTDFAAYWMNSDRRKFGGSAAVPGWTDYSDYLADVCVKFLAFQRGEPLVSFEKNEVARILRDQPGLASAASLILDKFPPKPKSIPVSVRPSSTHRSHTLPISKPRLTLEKIRADRFKDQWEKIFTPTNIAKLTPLFLAESRKNNQQAPASQGAGLKQLQERLERLQSLKKALPSRISELETVQLLWIPDAQVSSFTLAEFKKN